MKKTGIYLDGEEEYLKSCIGSLKLAQDGIIKKSVNEMYDQLVKDMNSEEKKEFNKLCKKYNIKIEEK